MKPTALGIALLSALIAMPVVAQEPIYPDFSSTQGLTLIGSAVQEGTTLRLSDGVTFGDPAVVWADTPVRVVDGFTTSMEVSFEAPTGTDFFDGIFLTLQAGGPMTQPGQASFGLGMADSIAIGIETSSRNGTSSSLIKAYSFDNATNTTLFSQVGREFIPHPVPGQVMKLTVMYTPAPGMLYIYLNNAREPLLSLPYDLPSEISTLVGGTDLYTGMVAMAGLNRNRHPHLHTLRAHAFRTISSSGQPNTDQARLTIDFADGPDFPVQSSIDVIARSGARVSVSGAPNAPFSVYLSPSLAQSPLATPFGQVDIELATAVPFLEPIFFGFGQSTRSSGQFLTTIPLDTSMPETPIGAMQMIIADPTAASGSTLSGTTVVSLDRSDVGRTLHVSRTGSDTASGLSPQAALASLRRALAISQPGDRILIEDQVFDERGAPLQILEQRHIIGGCAPGTFIKRRGAFTTIEVGPEGVAGKDINATTRIENLKIFADPASGVGESSTGLRLANCGGGLVFFSCHFAGDHGADGRDGSAGGRGYDGTDGETSTGILGGRGGRSRLVWGPLPDPGSRYTTVTDPWVDHPHSGTRGGDGGYQGTSYQATAGLSLPRDPLQSPTTWTLADLLLLGGTSGRRTNCLVIGADGGAGQNGLPGADSTFIAQGAPESVFELAPVTGLPVLTSLHAADGRPGVSGTGGTGGGGGAGWNCALVGHPQPGGGGGGGGGGGSAGGPGQGGFEGGSSVAAVLLNTDAGFSNCVFIARNGGRGGQGGPGGRGGAGGLGGGRFRPNVGGWYRLGGDGGSGGAGGYGSGGAGGRGGSSIGIWSDASSGYQLSGNTTFTTGLAGVGGLGGVTSRAGVILTQAAQGPAGRLTNVYRAP